MAGSDATLPALRRALLDGQVIPAHPLALTAARRLDERRQAALTRYYCDAGAGGIAVGVHTTQFAIRDPSVGLFAPVLELASRTVRDWCRDRRPRPVMIAGVVRRDGAGGGGSGAGGCARLRRRAAEHGRTCATPSNASMLEHCRRVAEVIPVVGFYLQPAVGGRVLDRSFWRGFLDIEHVVAIKVAPFDRYRTLDVVAA